MAINEKSLLEAVKTIDDAEKQLCAEGNDAVTVSIYGWSDNIGFRIGSYRNRVFKNRYGIRNLTEITAYSLEEARYKIAEAVECLAQRKERR